MRILLLVLLLGTSNLLLAQNFPIIQGELLNNEQIELPTDAKGKYTLIGIAYSQKAEAELRTWYGPSIDKFIVKIGMFDSEYDVNIYFIPMFHGVNKMAYNNSFKQVKELTDERLYDRVVFYKGEIKSYKESLELESKEHPVFFMLDKDGKIIKRWDGKFKESYFEEVIEIIDNAG